MNIRRSRSHSCPACSRTTTPESTDTVPRAAFDRLRLQINELAEVVLELTHLQPGANQPLPQPGMRARASAATGGFNQNEMDDFAPGVIHLAFPGSRDRNDKMTDLLTQAQLDAAAWALFDRWIESFGH